MDTPKDVNKAQNVKPKSDMPKPMDSRKEFKDSKPKDIVKDEPAAAAKPATATMTKPMDNSVMKDKPK